MYSDAAYKAGLPCKNPNCKSNGQPHPNCRCYNNVAGAKGGEVGDFCSTDGKHDKGCEYFAEGGEVGSFDSLQADAAPLDDAAPTSAMPATQPTTPPKFDDLQDDSQKDAGNFDGLQDDSEKYGTTGQQIGTVAEGLAQGFLGPVATGVEKGLSALGVPNLSDEDIAGRAATNPWEHGLSEAAGLGAGLLTGTGEAGLAAKAAEGLAEASKMGKVGSAILKGAVSNGLIQGGDEISKAMLGQGDPATPVSSALLNIGAAGLFGGAISGAGQGAMNVASSAAENLKLGTKLSSFLDGVAVASKFSDPEERTVLEEFLKETAKHPDPELRGLHDNKAFKYGVKAFDGGLDKLTNIGAGGVGGTAGAIRGYDEDGITGAVKGGVEGYLLGTATAIAGKTAAKIAQPIIASTIYRILGSESLGNISGALDYAAKVGGGVDKTQKAINDLFKVGTQQIFNADSSDKNREKLKDYISKGGISQSILQQTYKDNKPKPIPKFAKGGLVKDPLGSNKPVAEVEPLLHEHEAVAHHFPEQNMLLQAAKTRISNYLSALQPQQHQSKLAFDDDNSDDKEAHKSYNNALDIANNPLSVLSHIKNGTLEPEHITHIQAMYPEATDFLKKKLTERITKAQLDGEKPSFKVRQGLSDFMGVPLSGEMTQPNIAAAQAVFATQKASQQQNMPAPKNKNKKGTSSLSKVGGSYLTGDQARQERQNKV